MPRVGVPAEGGSRMRAGSAGGRVDLDLEVQDSAESRSPAPGIGHARIAAVRPRSGRGRPGVAAKRSSVIAASGSPSPVASLGPPARQITKTRGIRYRCGPGWRPPRILHDWKDAVPNCGRMAPQVGAGRCAHEPYDRKLVRWGQRRSSEFLAKVCQPSVVDNADGGGSATSRLPRIADGAEGRRR